MFDVGEKVVCVDDKFPDWIVQKWTELPVKDVVYVVRDVVPAHNYGKNETCAILLTGLTGFINELGVENGFAAHRFRPLEEIKEEKAMKKSKKQTIDAEL